jgi:hypothetical protein
VLTFSASEPGQQYQVYGASQNLQNAVGCQYRPCHLTERMLTRTDTSGHAGVPAGYNAGSHAGLSASFSPGIPSQGMTNSEFQLTPCEKNNTDSKVSATSDDSYIVDGDFRHYTAPNNCKYRLSLTDLNKYSQPQITPQLPLPNTQFHQATNSLVMVSSVLSLLGSTSLTTIVHDGNATDSEATYDSNGELELYPSCKSRVMLHPLEHSRLNLALLENKLIFS